MDLAQLKSVSRVVLIDDDQDVLHSLDFVISMGGYRTEKFLNPLEVLNRRWNDNAVCFVTDLAMPHLTGLDLLKELKSRQIDHPILFLTSRGSVAAAVEAMKLGATDFLEKPVETETLFSLINRMLERDFQSRETNQQVTQIKQRFSTLTPREREIVQYISDGIPTKAIASRLNLSIKTIEVHRSKISHKFGAKSLANLMLILAKLNSLQG